MEKKKVIVLGGGVAGMTAAHELIERGFDVALYEYKDIPGGKARSMPVPGSGTDGRQDLPGEHGFRLFPGFYKHVTDTMKRIPYGDNPAGVFDNLVNATRTGAARYNYELIELLNDLPHSISDFKVLFKAMFFGNFGMTQEEVEWAGEKFWQILSSSTERKINEYQNITWWNFVEADRFSDAFRTFFASITRFTVAAKAKKANTRTIGDVATELMLNVLTPGVSDDRVLNGPTNDVWIGPWMTYLRDQGVDYHLAAEVVALECKGGVITGATIREDGKEYQVTGDYYIAAVPVEQMVKLINEEMLQADPTLQNLFQLKDHTDWMNGIQFYLKDDVTVNHGHTVYLDSPWALTSISQRQFWPDTDLSQYGDGTVKGILSVDISDWSTPGFNGKTAMECTQEEIREEVWHQLKQSLNHGTELLKDENLHSFFLDSDIHFDNPHKVVNIEPLLVNEVGTYELRPNAFTAIPNLFLASDYVRTNTDLATMEGANEAARRAVNCVISASGYDVDDCEIWAMYEPLLLAPWRAHDLKRYKQGLPWDGKLFG